jgi:lipid-binding SYLF domain-containing protein
MAYPCRDSIGAQVSISLGSYGASSSLKGDGSVKHLRPIFFVSGMWSKKTASIFRL